MNFCLSDLRYPAPWVQTVVDEIASLVNMPTIPIYASGTPNACATTFTDKSPVITFNPEFLQPIKDINYWAFEAVIAHEIGHHYYGHVNIPRRILETSHERELVADKFAGYILKYRGAPLQDGVTLYHYLNPYRTDTHPDRNERIASFKKGWVQANKELNPHLYQENPWREIGKAAAAIGVGIGIGSLIIAIARS